MNNPVIQAPVSNNPCVIAGVPPTYTPDEEYTISVGCSQFDGGSGCAHLFTASSGSFVGKQSLCVDVGAKTTSAQEYIWKAPNTDDGDVSFEALCGHQSAMVRSGTSVTSFNEVPQCDEFSCGKRCVEQPHYPSGI